MIYSKSEFVGKVALVTGGTSGIGYATALAFAQAGATVIFAGRRETEGFALEEKIRSFNGAGYFFKTDVSHEAEIVELINFITAKFGRLDIAFNNAGIALEGEVTEVSFEDYRQTFDVNFWGVMAAMKHEILTMLCNGGGTIVNTSSIFGHVGGVGLSVYSASKHAIEGLTKTSALEYARQGIRVNAVAPAFIETPMVDRSIGKQSKARDQLASMHPNGRLGLPDDVANAVLFLCSSASSLITGESLKVDGGWTAR